MIFLKEGVLFCSQFSDWSILLEGNELWREEGCLFFARFSPVGRFPSSIFLIGGKYLVDRCRQSGSP